MFPKTFCVLPFSQITIDNDGKAKLCTHAHAFNMMSKGRSLSLHWSSWENIWNSDYLRSVRRLMLEGKEVEACTKCYGTEADGGTSLRQVMNSHHRYRLEASDDDQLIKKAEAIVRENGGNAPPPSALHLWLGNLCNLKCRMCSPTFSSRIASDPIHSKWLGEITSSENLLPFFLDEVKYSGFGELLKRGGKFTRKVAMGSATITFPPNGDAIDFIEITGWKYSSHECHLLLMTEDQILTNQWLPRGKWRVWFKPDFVWQPRTEIKLSLNFQGSGEFIEIDNLEIAVKSISGKEKTREILSRIPESRYWSNSEKVIGELFANAESLQMIHFSGGEPLIHPSFSTILEKLVETGHASHIGLYINSNGTVYSRRLSSLLNKFSFVELAVSIDGVGELQEYIRYASKWDILSKNILAFQKDNIPISIRPTIQSYNIFGMLDLVRWCDQYELPFFLDNILYSPRFLSLDMLPQIVIEDALESWMKYLDNECTKENRWHIETVIAALKRPRPKSSLLSVLQDEFIRFTNDLDQSRNQSLAIICPQLYKKLINASFDFQDKYRFFKFQLKTPL